MTIRRNNTRPFPRDLEIFGIFPILNNVMPWIKRFYIGFSMKLIKTAKSHDIPVKLIRVKRENRDRIYIYTFTV